MIIPNYNIALQVEKFGKSAMARYMDQGDEDDVRREIGLSGGGGTGFSISGGGNTGNSDFTFKPYAGKFFCFNIAFFFIFVVMLLKLNKFC